MTAALIAPADLSLYEFSIPCQVRGCPHEAAVSCKGCCDPRHALVCRVHLQATEDRFERNFGKQCAGCLRPFWEFDTHYSVAEL